MSVAIDEDRTRRPRLGLAVGFAEEPPGGRGAADLWRRLWLTLGALILYRLGTYLPIPGIDPVAASAFFQARESGIFGLLDLFGGGSAVHRFSITALGIAPYLSALVIVQLASYIVPRLRSLAIEGLAGRRVLNQYTRVLTVAIAGLQAAGFAVAIETVPGLVVSPSVVFDALTVVTLVAGAILLMWLSEQITERGIGDGAVLILACSVASRLPIGFAGAFELVRTGELETYWLPSTLAAAAAILLLVVIVERAVRRIWIHDPAGEIGVASSARGYTQVLPLPINPSGILVPLVASVFTTPLWGIAVGIGERDASWLGRLASSGIGYVLAEGLLIFFLAVFFGFAAFDPEQIAKRLKDSRGWIPGFHPGDNTARYLRRTRAVLTLVGAVYLVAVCVLPDFVYRWFHLPLPLSAFSFFLLAWVMVRILERMRASWHA